MITKIFNNTKRAFALKNNDALNRSLFIFEMLNRPFLVKIGIKLTSFGLKLNLPLEGIIKKTIFKQFCGGTSEQDCLPVIKEMYTMHLRSVLDYSSEGKKTDEEFDAVLERIIEIMEFAATRKEIPYTILKPSGIGRLKIWEKVSAEKELTAKEQQEWEHIKVRMHKICRKAYEADIPLLADAEEYRMQTAADDLMEEMMMEYNQEEVVIYNTLQCYRWDRLQYMKNLHNRAKNKGFKIGAKIVRGAYMEKENARAKKMGYPTPICEDKEATDVNFNATLSYALQNIEDIHLFIGTHNEVSTYLAMQLMDEKGLKKDDPRIWFSQLYGMSDHISYNLALNGYNSAKYLPFGPIKEVIPYLMRRAQENTSVKGQTGRELALLREEKQRREGKFVKRVQ